MFQVGQPKEVDDLVYGGKLKGGFFLEARFSFSLLIAFGSVSKMFFSRRAATILKQTLTHSTGNWSTGGLDCWWNLTRFPSVLVSPSKALARYSQPARIFMKDPKIDQHRIFLRS